MKKKILYFIAASLLFCNSCSKDENTTPPTPPTVDFGFSVTPTSDNKFLVKCSNASSGVTEGSSLSWILDGVSAGSGFSSTSDDKTISQDDGVHSIVLKIITPQKISYSKTKSFFIKNLEIISADFPADTTKKVEPIVDFGYSVIFKGSSIITLNCSDASSNIRGTATYSWEFDGTSISSAKSFNADKTKVEGTHHIVLRITTSNKVAYSKTKRFTIKDNSIISEDFPADTSKLSVPNIDFGYSVTPFNSTTISLHASDASSSLPINSTFSWLFDGQSISTTSSVVSKSFSNSDGLHNLVLQVTTADNNVYSKSKSFLIKNKAVITDEFPYDTTNVIKPIVDFSYSIKYSGNTVYIGVNDASSNIIGSDYESYFYINGSPKYGGNGANILYGEFPFNSNGRYSITHKIIVNNIAYSISKEFDVTGIK